MPRISDLHSPYEPVREDQKPLANEADEAKLYYSF